MSRLDRRTLFTSGAAAALLSAAGLSAQASPRRGGTLRFAVCRSPAPCPVMAGAVFETLTDIGPDGVLRPMLAMKWDSQDAANWHVTLREDAFFHDGTNVDAVAVGKRLSNVMPNVSVRGKHKINISLDAPDPNLPWRMADPDFSIASENGAGSGFYRLKDHRRSGHFVAERVLNHHRDGLAGWADRIELVAVSGGHDY